MKFLHISDLHLGRKMYNVSFLPYQKTALENIIGLIESENIDAVLIAGDVYDKSVPVVEAVSLFDEFLTALAKIKRSVFIISGNHDSSERLNFGSRILDENNIHIAGVFNGKLQKSVVYDDFGAVNVYMLPFLKQSMVSAYFPDENFENLSEAVGFLIKNTDIDYSQRNILMYHGFVLYNSAEPETSDSEVQLGGMQIVNAEIFSDFDYTALGHIHKPQWIKTDKIRYSGSLMKYSFSESMQKKTVTIIEINEKGNIKFTYPEIISGCDMRVIRGEFSALMDNAEPSDDLFRAELTDDDIVPYSLENLRTVYPNILELVYLKQTERISASATETDNIQEKSLEELTEIFFKNVCGFELDDEPDARLIIKKICREAEKNI